MHVKWTRIVHMTFILGVTKSTRIIMSIANEKKKKIMSMYIQLAII